MASFSSSLPAAQLDNIGFSIIKRCIHAVETRGRVLSPSSLGLGCGFGAVCSRASTDLLFSWADGCPINPGRDTLDKPCDVLGQSLLLRHILDVEPVGVARVTSS